MVLKIYNTLSRKEEIFKPIKKGAVGMYSCGPTVYNYPHIGNYRAYVAADLLKRYLEFKGFSVKQVMNITDVDDKTIHDSQKEGRSLKEFTFRYEKAFMEDLEVLNIERANLFPRATEHIPEMVKLISFLLKKGIAYKGDDGSVYYSVSKFKDYGKLANIRVDELKAGVRVKQDEYDKESASDFALWKAWDKSDGNVFWEAPFGKGRPGWHIECSAMSMKYLGKHFDIHTGGADLVFPHHENEIAQSEAYSGKKFVNYWLHNAWLLVDGKKMSKSLGNFYTLCDVLKKGYSGREVRYLLLSTHYRQQLNFTFDGLAGARGALQKLDEFVLRLKTLEGGSGSKLDKNLLLAPFEVALDDDLNISRALSVLFDFMTNVNIAISKGGLSLKERNKILDAVDSVDSVLGLKLIESADEKLKIPADVMNLVEEREKARAGKNWKNADKLREKILRKGYFVKDTASGAVVSRS